MTRKKKTRQKTKRRKDTSRPAYTPVGWPRFAAGIAVGAALGIAAVLIPDWPFFDPPGSANKVIAAPSPESRDPSTGARVNIPAPAVVETAAKPAKLVQKPASQPLVPPAVVETQAAAAPELADDPVGAQILAGESAISESAPARIAPDVASAQDAPLQDASGKKTPSGDGPAQTAVPSPVQEATLGIVDRYASGGAGDPVWLRNSVAFSVPRGSPVIAIVLDDVGVNKANAEAALKLPPEITLSLMTYAEDVDKLAARARARGNELLVHMPMEPTGGEIDPGPNALKVELTDAEILKRVRWGLDRFDGYVGANNHMGSRFTQDTRGMQIVIDELRRRSLLFLDSRTIANSVGDRLATQAGIAHVTRDVFLDDVMSVAASTRQLNEAERIARRTGQAIAIGHPHPSTIQALKAWLPQAKARGVIIAPLSVVAKRQLGVTG